MRAKGIHRPLRPQTRGDLFHPPAPVEVDPTGRQPARVPDRLPSAQALVAGVPLVIWVALVSVLLRYGGAVWDVSWHLTIGRDTFWSPPHLGLYAGTALGLVAAAWALGEARQQPDRFPGRWWGIGPLRLPFGYSLAFIGALIILLSAPFDDLWHFMFGRDVDIWSPPHLTAVFGGAVNVYGLAAALVPYLAAAPNRAPGRTRNRPTAGSASRATAQSPFPARQWAVVLQWVFLAHLIYTAWFSLNWYFITAATRDVLLYPSLVGLVLLPCLVASAFGGTGRWSATVVALIFTVLALLPVAFFTAIDWRAVALPPLVIVPAFALDLLLRRPSGSAGMRQSPGSTIGATILAGGTFAVLFLAVELVRMQVMPPIVPDLGITGAQILAPYLAAAGDRPWTLPGIAAAFPVVIVASVVGAAVGRLLGSVLRSEKA